MDIEEYLGVACNSTPSIRTNQYQGMGSSHVRDNGIDSIVMPLLIANE